jgi:hypothetical protein
MAKAYADYMITHGRDRYGRVHSPLFATTLNRETGTVFRKNPPKAPKGIRLQDRTWRGANPANNMGLYGLLYKLTAVTGDPLYKNEANKAIDWFFENCQSEKTGLMAWGEHMGWDFFKEKPITWNPLFFLHEYKEYGYWDRVWETNPKAAERFARGLWDHQIYAKEGEFAGEFSRHANYFLHLPAKGRAFPSHGGKYIKVWARAYRETKDGEFIRAIETLLDYFESKTSPRSGAIAYATDYPDQYSLSHNMGLASALYQAMDDVPESLASRMKSIADRTDPLYLGFNHDPGPGGQGFIKYAHVHTLEPGEQRKVHQDKNKTARTEKWSSGYSASRDSSSANKCYDRYLQTGIKEYLDLFILSAQGYYQSPLPETAEQDIYPSNYSGVISMMGKMYQETGDMRYMERARELLEISLDLLMDETSPLPKASRMSEHYEVITGADSLMNNALEMWLFLNEPRDEDGLSTGITLTTDQLTHGPEHHLFGYIGQSLTIPWNASDHYILALETDFHDRLPAQEDYAKVVLVDTLNSNQIIELDKTLGWNLQQGTMFYWNPQQPDAQFFFNDRDRETGQVFTVLYDLEKRKRIREYRFPGRSIGNGGVSPTGGFFAAINYGRMARLRPVTGYAGAWDPTKGVNRPDDDGLFLVDIDKAEANLLISYEQLGEFIESSPGWLNINKRWSPVAEGGESLNISDASLYINHSLINRSGDRIYFFVRGRVDGRSIWLNAPCSIKTDGTELTLHTTSIGGHPEWAEGDLMIGAHEGNQVFYDVSTQKILQERILGDRDILPNPEGDVSLSPDGKWFVNGYSSEDRKTISYVIMRLGDGAYVRSERFDRGPYTKGNLRTDPAPRWNRNSDQILVPGWTDEGTRQLFTLKIYLK